MGPRLGDFLRQLRFHFAVLREALEVFLRKDQLVTELDLENTVLSLDEVGFNTELLLDFVRQTGGSGQIVSNYTIFNGQLGHLRLL